MIRSLKHIEGKEVCDEERMDTIAKNYFIRLFSFNGYGDTSHMLSGIKHRIF